MSRVHNKWIALLLTLAMVCLSLGGSVVASAESSVGQVTGLKAGMASSTSINLSWNSMDEASGYQLWRSTSKDSGYISIKSLTSNTTSNGYALGYGETVYYKVRAYRLTESGDRVYGEFSSPVSVTNNYTPPKAQKVTGLTGKMASSTQISLSWDKQGLVSGYQLWRSTSSRDSGYISIKSITSNTTSNGYSLSAGETVYYKVRAYVDVNGERVYGEFSDPISVTNTAPVIKAQKVTGLKGSMASSTKINLSWDKQEGLSGYQVWRSTTSRDSGYISIKSITTNVTENGYSLQPGKTVYYKVRGYVIKGGERVYGEFSDPIAVTNSASSKDLVKVQNFTAKLNTSTGRVNMTWTAQSVATGYQLMYSTSPNGELKGIKSTGKNISSDYTGVTPSVGQTWYYRLRAYFDESDGSRTYGEFSDAVAVTNSGTTVQVGKVTGISARVASSTQIALSWTAQSEADGYQLWRSSNRDSGYISIKSFAGNSTTTGYTLQVGESVYFKVRAYVDVSGQRVYGEYSEPIGVSQNGTATTVTQVTGLTGKMLNSNTISLTWNAQAGVRGYQVWRSELPDSGFVSIKTITTNTTENTYTLAEGSSVFYKVRALTDDASGNRIYGEFSEVLEVRNGDLVTVPAVVTGLKGSVSGANEITLTWTKQVGVSGYQIWRSTDKDSGYISVKSIVPNINNTVTNFELGFKETVYYKVRAFVVNAAGGYTYGAFSEPAAVTNSSTSGDLRKVTNFTAKLDANSSKVSLSWTAQANATGYQLLYSTTINGAYTGIKSTGKNISSDTTAVIPEPGKTWYYRLRAYIEDGKGNRIYGEYSDAVEISNLGIPQNLKVVTATDKAFQLSWTAVSGATGYLVYYSTAENGTYALAQTVTGTTVTVNISSAQPNTTYYFKVGAYRMDGTVQQRGTVSAPVSVKTADGIVINAVNHYTSVDLSWNHVAAYNGYVVYRKTATGSYALLSGSLGFNGTDWTFTDTTAVPNNSYIYSVVGYTEQDGNKVYATVGTYAKAVGTWLPGGTMSSAKATAGSNSSVTMKLRWSDKLDISIWDIQYSTLPTTGFTSLITVQDPNPEVELEYLSYDYTNSVLTAGKTYYFRVRPGVVKDGVTYYGSWSTGMVSAYVPSITARDITVGSTTQSVLLYVSNGGNQSMGIGGSAVYYPLGASYGGYSMSGAGGTVGAGSAATLTFNYTDLASHYRNSSSSLSFTFTSGGSTYRVIATGSDSTAWTLE